MGALHFAVATVIGFMLYQFTVVYVGGFLAAVAIPSEYFQFFGREYQGVGHALLGMALHALPTVLLGAGGVLAAERFRPRRASLVALPYCLGMLSCLLVWEFLQSTGCLPSLEAKSTCAQASIERFFTIPWWAWPVVASPWLGLGLASWLLKRMGKAGTRGVA